MTEFSRIISAQCPMRRTKLQKARFRLLLKDGFEKLGYGVELETDRFLLKSKNVVVGDIDSAEYVFTAHYDTASASLLPDYYAPRSLFFTIGYKVLRVALLIALMFLFAAFGALGFLTLSSLITDNDTAMRIIAAAGGYCGAALPLLLSFLLSNRNNANDNTSGVITLTEIAARLPQNLRDKVAFVFFDNGERLMLGSAGFAEKHPGLADKTAVNFDCVGSGSVITFIFSNKTQLSGPLAKAAEQTKPNDKELLTITSALTAFYSDHRNIKNAIGVTAMKKSRMSGGYVSKIHTPRDRNCDERNINLISEIITKAVK